MAALYTSTFLRFLLFYFCVIVTIFLKSSIVIFLQMSMWRCSDELRVRADELHRSATARRDAKHYIGN